MTMDLVHYHFVTLPRRVESSFPTLKSKGVKLHLLGFFGVSMYWYIQTLLQRSIYLERTSRLHHKLGDVKNFVVYIIASYCEVVLQLITQHCSRQEWCSQTPFKHVSTICINYHSIQKCDNLLICTFNSQNEYSETDIIRMVEFLIDNFYVGFGGHVYQQIVGISMGTNCKKLRLTALLMLQNGLIILIFV